MFAQSQMCLRLNQSNFTLDSSVLQWVEAQYFFIYLNEHDFEQTFATRKIIMYALHTAFDAFLELTVL